MCRRVLFLASLVFVLCRAGYGDLVAHWDLNEGSGTTTAAAVGSPAADGTFVGTTWLTTGLSPAGGTTAAAFFNSSNSDRIETNLTGITGQAARTVAAWIKAEPTQNNNAVMVGWGLNNPTERWSFRLNASAGNGSQWALRLEIQGSYAITQTPLNDGQWHHVAATHDDGATIEQVSFYVDGQLEGGLSGTSGGGSINTAASNVVIGNSGHSVAGYGFDGAIDDVRLYDHALSDVEVLAAMEGSSGGYPLASGPNPADGALLEATWANMSWRAGDSAVSHDVYLGDSFDGVNEGAEGTFAGNQATTMLVVGFPGFPVPGGLVPGATYYWRIDEVNDADPNSPWKGPVWSFSIAPKTAYNPDPADDAESVAQNAELTWAPGFEAKLHTVYFGDNFDDVNNASGGLLLGDITFTPPGPLELAKTYYWRVDESDPPSTYRGEVWSFRTEGTAADPIPVKGAVEVSPTPIVKWTAANLAASHEVYFGVDADAVAIAGKGSPEYKGAKALGEETYDAGRLELQTTYYWRIDEVNDTQPGSPWIGNVWSFTTGDFLVVDDFEAYNDIDPPDPNSNRIFDNWIDGFGTTTNGALVGNDLPPYAEQGVVHGGAQSMIYAYDNAGKTSEATLTLAYPRDWTTEGVTKLSLWVRGSSTNAADRLFIALNGTAVVYHDDPAATQIGGWRQWVIDLTAFGVNLTNVNTITIGIGTKNSPAAGGTGTMYFDDIRLIR